MIVLKDLVRDCLPPVLLRWFHHLITGIGGDISQGVATILRENRPDLRLIEVDMHPQHGGHLFVVGA